MIGDHGLVIIDIFQIKKETVAKTLKINKENT